MRKAIEDAQTYAIIGCAMTVHRTLGLGYQEIIYQRALIEEFRKRGIPYIREQEIPIYYDGKPIGSRRVDFLVYGKILLEIKAVRELEKAHIAQAINYLEAYKLPKGLLINFGHTSLQYRRLIKEREFGNQVNNGG
jgi:GxxExxY protein